MSREAAVAFYERLEGDRDLMEKIRELGTREAIRRYVKEELGYDFTREEMQKAISERNPQLSEVDLESVVGGTTGAVIIASTTLAAATAA